MKSIYVLLVVFSLVSIGLQAQELTNPKTSPWGWGVFAGVTLNHPLIKTRFPEHYKPFPGTQAGVDVSYRLSSRATLHGQPSAAQVSNRRLDDGWLSPIYNLITLKIPLSYRYYVLPNQRTLFIEAGAGYNQIVISDYRERQYVECFAAPCPQVLGPALPLLSTIAVSGMVGMGVDIPIDKITIPILVRYERYLSDSSFSKPYDGQNAHVKFQTLSLTTGVNF